MVARQSESALQACGRSLAAEARLGSVVCVELTNDTEKQPWCLVVVTKDLYEIKEELKSYCGLFKPADLALDVTKLEPISSGARTFVKTDRNWPIFAKDVRMIDIEHTNKTRGTLWGSHRSTIFCMCCLVGSAADQRTRLALPMDTMQSIDSKMMYQ